jgi:hypothetical protein
MRHGLLRENEDFGDKAGQSATLLAAKRRKNAAHGVSRGEKRKTDKPERGAR